MKHLSHWDDARSARRAAGAEIAATWHNLGGAMGSVATGAQRIEIEPGKRPTPAHDHGAEEEIFYVLAGTGTSWRDGVTTPIVAGDGIIYRPNDGAHTIVAGLEGLDVLAFGQRLLAEVCHLPRAQIMWAGPAWIPDAVAAGIPFEQEAAAGPLPMPEPTDRPPWIVHEDALERDVRERPGRRLTQRDFGTAGGARATALVRVDIEPNAKGFPMHCHSAEEELFVVLEGSGTVTVGTEDAVVRRGSLLARPAGTRLAHGFRAGPQGLSYLVFGNHDTNDICFYPDSGKLSIRGVGVIGRIEQVDYWDGEDG